ncbi:MAG TPA: class II aldolase/adducin family protein [Candidatus Limnocylindria bacterium]|jgi:ribulose-5-phosphate 4-epimerase/fuculose-1-phosphate aldolase|nr:class II aldolase/adducin family protein [Candidatus Limnocylindria bacterium]
MSVSSPARAALLVAAASRALAVAGIFDMHGHVSLREGDVAYVNSHSASRIALRPEEVAVVRLADGEPVERTPPSELSIHLEIYRARADVGAVAHFHALYATALAVAGKPLVAAFNAGAPFGREVPVYDDPALIRDSAQGRRLAGVLGSGRAAVLRGHGAVVVGNDLPTCVAMSLQLEESARRLWLTYAIGEPRRFSDEEIARVAGGLTEPRVIRKIWIDALERTRLAGALGDIELETII